MDNKNLYWKEIYNDIKFGVLYYKSLELESIDIEKLAKYHVILEFQYHVFNELCEGRILSEISYFGDIIFGNNENDLLNIGEVCKKYYSINEKIKSIIKKN